MTQSIKSTEQTTMTLGQLFRQTRESLNLSLEDVSGEINLRLSILKYLETDSFVHKSIPTAFMKGYIRSYAKFLRLPESEWSKLVPTLDETTHNDLSKNTRSTQAVNQFSPQNHRWMTYITLLIVFVVAGMTALWWWENYQQSNQERETLVQNYEQNGKGSENSSLNTTEKTIVDTNIATMRADSLGNKDNKTTLSSDSTAVSSPVAVSENTSASPVVPMTQGFEQTTANQPIVEQAGNSMMNNGENSALNSSEPISSAQTLQMEMNKLTESSATNSSVNTSTTSSAVALTGDLQIEITEGSCWISVKDANRKVLAQKEYMKGEVLSFSGNAPYSLIIGAPGNVKITYKGELFPLKVDGRVAKFKLE